jgi:hypothetical protein
MALIAIVGDKVWIDLDNIEQIDTRNRLIRYVSGVTEVVTASDMAEILKAKQETEWPR